MTAEHNLYNCAVMTLTVGVRALMSQVHDIAMKTGFSSARVDAKLNRHGELVVALLVPPRSPDEWGDPPPLDRREAARRARQSRS